LQEFRWSWK